MTARARLLFEAPHGGERAGICVRANETFHAALVVAAGPRGRELRLECTVGGVTTTLGRRVLGAGPVTVEIEASAQEYRFGGGTGRVREVGVLKTLGFAPGEILGLILGEALSISIAGGLIGYLISTGLMQMVAKSPIGGFLPTLPLIEPAVAAACIGTAGLVGLMSALVPAMGASRMSIVQALRTTD